jgi:dTDP-4-dehydrorhamnose reductase
VICLAANFGNHRKVMITSDDPPHFDDMPLREGPALRGHRSDRERSTMQLPLAMWGGLECTINRVGDRYFTQLDRSGHDARPDDLERFASLGLRALRYPVLWEATAPDGVGTADWSRADRGLAELARLGVAPIVGLVHHGSGPRHTGLLDPGFAIGLAAYAEAVATRYPWVEYWTPVNEPLTTARFSALYGIWYPHAQNDGAFVTALLNQCRATVLSMQAIRRINPAAQLIQTDDLSRTYGTEPLTQVVDFYNERRWLGWDLLCSRVDEQHPLWDYLVDSGATAEELRWFEENSCPPDVIGANYYVTSERWLDHRIDDYPGNGVGESGGVEFVDVESVRVLSTRAPGIASLLEETWGRYRIPLAVTEAHIDACREDQLRWLLEIWRGAELARTAGAEVRAVTAWSLLGSFDWNCLLSECRGYYEAGAYDVRSTPPRATALAALIADLAAGRTPSHPMAQGDGWWRRPERFLVRPIALSEAVTTLARYRSAALSKPAAPILISGATGTLGRAFATVCTRRNLPYQLLDRTAMDIADSASVAAALDRWQPWALVNASGYVRIDAAESDTERCLRENVIGPAVLAAQCAASNVRLVTFSSDQVFDGSSVQPWVESDTPAPLNAYGRSKAAAEKEVLALCPQAMVVRTSAFFGPWDHHNFASQALAALRRGTEFWAGTDVRVSPTYVPDLVNACLDLLIDGERGLWHLANDGDVSWLQFAERAAMAAGVDASALRPTGGAERGQVAARPRYGVLSSERAALMPTLDDALARFAAETRSEATAQKRFTA